MSREVVFDIETTGDIRNFAELEMTVVSICETETGKYSSYTKEELINLWPILEKAERLIGYNSESFDIPILNKYYAGDLKSFPHLDLLKVIKESSGKRYRLNDIAKATLQIEKSADGLQAMKWWDEGKIDEIKKYCEQDVRVTKEIYEYGIKNRMLYYPTITGEILPIAVNFEMPVNQTSAGGASNSINMTLPF